MSERGLLLDLGGTAFGSGLERLAVLGEREPAVRSIVARRGPLGPAPDPLWDAMLRGEITERGYWQARSAEVGAALGRAGWPITEFMHLLYGLVENVLRPEAAALVADAKAAGVRVGALTNDLAAFHGDAGMSGDPFIASLDALVDGSVTGVLKPDPRAYAMAAEAMGLPPSSVARPLGVRAAAHRPSSFRARSNTSAGSARSSSRPIMPASRAAAEFPGMSSTNTIADGGRPIASAAIA